MTTALDRRPAQTVRAVVLARGLGTRMRRDDGASTLTDAQSRAADAGMKAMIPIGRPFLDFVLSALADAGFSDVCLVIGPEHEAVRRHFLLESPPQRVKVHFAEQAEPRGTADAVLAAESFVAGHTFVVINGDNYYPVDILRSLREPGGAGTVGFDRDALLAASNIEPERVAAFALMEVRDDGTLARIHEKPDAATLERLHAAPVSMNCWSLVPAVLEACRDVSPSSRGELELPSAVNLAVERGVRMAVIPARSGVLDLSRRGDVAAVAARLRGVEPRP